MSIVSLINPSSNQSVQDDLWHIATSDNSGQTDFKYVFDVYNQSNQQLVRAKVFPEPISGKGYFNVSNIVQNEITYDWFAIDNTLTDVFPACPSVSGQVATTYTIQIGEEYNGITTLNMASGQVTAYNYAPTIFKRRVDNINSKLNSWLSNRPTIMKVQRGQHLLIPFYCDTPSGGVCLNVYPNNSASNSTTLITTPSKFIEVDIGINSINSSYGGTLINSNCEFYDIEFYEDYFGGRSTKIRVYIDCQPKYTPINLYFINAYGMFDTACFDLASRLMLNLERKSFKKKEYNLNNTSVDYYNGNNVYVENKINYGSKSDFEYKLTMNYPTDAEYIWLEELIVSPQIYADIDGYYYPVSIKDNNYEFSKNQNNKLKALELTIELNQTRFGYRR